MHSILDRPMKADSVKIIFRSVAVLLSLSLGGCLGQGSPPTAAPTGFAVAAGESQVVLTWNSNPNLSYWIYYKQGTNTGLGNADKIIYQATSPYDLTGLTNGTQYAFAVTSSNSGSEAGPFTAVITATPRLIGPDATWTAGTALTTNDLKGIAFGGSNYVAVGSAATVFAAPFNFTSPGGVTGWTQVTALPITSSVNLTGVVYDGSRFVALGSDGTSITTTDSTTWAAATAIPGATGMNAIAFGAGTYVAVGNAGGIYSNANAGVTGAWTARTSGTTQNLYGVAFVNDQFIAVGAQGTLLTSPDGVTWTARTSNTPNALRGVTYGVGTYVAVGDAGTVVSSADGATWTEQTIPTTQSLYAVIFGPDVQFVAVGTSGAVIYSTTGTNGSWLSAHAGTIDLYGIAPNAVYIAVGAAGANASAK